jgi:hypothetical protein
MIPPRKFARVHINVTLYRATKTCVGVEVQLHAFLASALDGGEWLASRPVLF